MAKVSAASKLADAIAICDRLDAVENLNLSSVTLVKMARKLIEEDDGKFAFEIAHRADFMNEFSQRQQQA